MQFNKKVITIFVLILILAISSFGCGAKKNVKVEEKVKQIPVETAEVRQDTFTKAVILSGITKPNSTVTVIPKIAGAEKIVNLNIQVGDRVSAGQTIAVLDQSTVSIQLNSARTTYEDALRNYERNKVLYEAGAIPKSAFEQLEIALNQARNALDAQELAYNNTIIKSPISGIVTSVTAEVGSLASAQTPLATIVDIDTIEINCSINELQVNKIIVGEEVNIIIPAVGEEIFKGKIKSVSPTMDERTKAYPITIVVENKENRIKAGMYAEVEIVTDIHPDVLIVPAQAVIERNGETKVFIVENEKAVAREVVTGLTNGQKTEILKGIKKGDQVIIRGNEDVVNGDPVKVIERGEN